LELLELEVLVVAVLAAQETEQLELQIVAVAAVVQEEAILQVLAVQA
jgi:hypothetical protein